MVDGGAEMREDAGQPVGATAMLGHGPDDVPATPDSDDRLGVEGPVQASATELGDELGPRRNAAQSGDRAAVRRLCHTWTHVQPHRDLVSCAQTSLDTGLS